MTAKTKMMMMMILLMLLLLFAGADSPEPSTSCNAMYSHTVVPYQVPPFKEKPIRPEWFPNHPLIHSIIYLSLHCHVLQSSVCPFMVFMPSHPPR
ncbi:hypothetical protein HDV64DRAFT_260923 [Trichoderma sp. TUCIM 5745]